jgi:hypothetical protein
MSLPHRFAYLQARLQARYGCLPAEEEWERLSGTRSLSAFLEEARMGALNDWIKGFSSQSDVHDLEAAVRRVYRETVAQVASWVPKPWREAVVWTGWLPLLPLLDHVARGEPMPGWVARDHELQTLLEEHGSLSLPYLRRTGAAVFSSPDRPLAAIWTAQWRCRWPRCGGEARVNMDTLVKLVDDHSAAFLHAPPEGTWVARRGLRGRLRVLFHQRLLQPVNAFIYLALVALDLERLRAGLVTRALFAEQEEATA